MHPGIPGQSFLPSNAQLLREMLRSVFPSTASEGSHLVSDRADQASVPPVHRRRRGGAAHCGKRPVAAATGLLRAPQPVEQGVDLLRYLSRAGDAIELRTKSETLTSNALVGDAPLSPRGSKCLRSSTRQLDNYLSTLPVTEIQYTQLPLIQRI